MLLLASSVCGLFKWRQFEPEVILLAVGWYLRFSLSYRDVEELLAERGLHADHVTVWRWVQRYAPEMERRLRSRLNPTNDSWRVDETYIRVKGKWRFGLIDSAIRKEATEILLTPVQELDMVRMDFGRLHCYYRQPDITRAQFAYLAIYLVLIGNVAAGEARTERLFRGSDEGLYNLQFGKMRLPDNDPAVVIHIEPVRPTNDR